MADVAGHAPDPVGARFKLNAVSSDESEICAFLFRVEVRPGKQEVPALFFFCRDHFLHVGASVKTARVFQPVGDDANDRNDLSAPVEFLFLRPGDFVHDRTRRVVQGGHSVRNVVLYNYET